MGVAAVGRIAPARSVLTVSALASFVRILGILEARNFSVSLARRTGMDEAISSGAEGSRIMYFGWTVIMTVDEFCRRIG